MKSITLLICVSFLFTINAFGQDYEKLKASNVDKRKVKIAEDFALSFFTELKKGTSYRFQDEAIDVLKNQLTEQNQKVIYEQLKSQFGDFESLMYAETWIQQKDDSLQIIRLKGDFEKSNRRLEIRVVLNEANKIAGFWVKPWSDMLQ